VIYPIVKRGDPLTRRLSQPTTPVNQFVQELERMIEDMFLTMYAAKGVGLAAPQIGSNLRVAVVDITSGTNPQAKVVLINPEIVRVEGEISEQEGCLSLPGFSCPVLRPRVAIVKAQNAKGETFIFRGEGLLARALCHEIDHLRGILIG
jgi:peptide deformylase